MGLLCEFDVCEDFGFIEQTEEFGIIPDYSAGCTIFRETFLSVSRSTVPVDTGYLRSTLSAYYNDTYCSAETQCEYAQYVEYGTWRQMAQPYFEPALEAALDAAAPAWTRAQTEALAEEQRLQQIQAEQEAAAQAQMEQQESEANESSGDWVQVEKGDGENYKGTYAKVDGIGSSLGAVTGSFISALVGTLMKEIFAIDEQKYSNGKSGEGGVYLPEVIIT